MKKLFTGCLIIQVFSFGTISAQGTIIEKGEDKVRLFNARNDMTRRLYAEALGVLHDLSKSNPNDATIEGYIGECYFNMDKLDFAVEHLEKSKKLTENPYSETPLILGKTYHMMGEIDKALKELNAYRYTLTSETKIKETDIDLYISQCNTAKELMAKPVDVKIENLGDKINTKYADKKTSVTADGKKMVFTSRRPGTKGGKVDKESDNKYFEDIYIALWDSTTNAWGEAETMKGSINTEGHDACTSISPDGKQVFVYLNIPDKTGSGDIYISKVSGAGKWGTPKSIGKVINTSYYEDAACLSPDGKTLYYVSEYPKGGFGNGDIWMSTKISKTEWGPPVNLGPTINTPFDENGVYMHPDGKTLFFSSNGPGSMGKHDLFISRYENGQWTKPVNLGYPINSFKEDKNFILTTSGNLAYMTTDREGGFGEDDLYKVDLSNHSLLSTGKEGEKKKNNSGLSILQGRVINSQAGQGMEAEVNLFDEAGQKITSTTSNNEGDYFFTLPGGKKYTVKVEVKDFTPVNESFELPLGKDDTYTLVKHLLMVKEKK